MKKVLILGSTGSIGKQTLEVVKKFPRDFKIVGLACYSQVDLILKQAKEFGAKRVLIFDRARKIDIKKNSIKIFFGEEKLSEFIAKSGADIVVNAIVGAAGIKSTIVAIRAKKDIALANKESLVCAGEIIMSLARKNKVKIFPIDSEHSAIWQCLRGEDPKKIKRILLTCSGGPFFDKSREELKKVTFKDAANHPKWKMGNKISIDSATLANKGFEIIEACYLFGVDIDKIEVVIHRESVVHSMVEFCDNSIKAQIAVPDMRLPIQYALFYPERKTQVTDSVNFEKVNLTFQKPDAKLFPNLNYAVEAFKIDGTMPAVLNAANEEAIKLFSQGKIGFLDIARINSKVMHAHKSVKKPVLRDIFSADKWARKIVKRLLKLESYQSYSQKANNKTRFMNYVIIAAAGSGKRMKAKKNKIFLEIDKMPIICRTVLGFEKSKKIDGIVLVTRKSDIENLGELARKYKFKKNIGIISGGKERQDSVFEGLKFLKNDGAKRDDVVLVHNGANPFVDEKLIDNVIAAIRKHGAAICGFKTRDTIKEIKDEFVIRTLNRDYLWQIQTPQGARFADLLNAYQRAHDDKFLGTDDAMLLERIGHRIKMVPCEAKNIKITYPEDLA